MADLATSEDEGLTELLQALANPTIRHFIELLALEPRTYAELREHFDLTSDQVEAMRWTLSEFGIAKAQNKRVQLDRTGLDRVQRWLDRIAEIERHSGRPRLE
jgi:hypothetical protein